MESRWKIASLAATAAVVLVGCNLFGGSSPTPPDEPESPDSADNDNYEVTWDDPLDVATGNAYRGPWRMNESDFHYVDDPDVAIGDDGRIGVVWVDNEAQDAFFQLFAEDGTPLLDEPTNVSRTGDVFSWLPRVEIGDDPDTVYVLWQEIAFTGGSHGGETLFARSTDGGQSFEPPVNLSNTTAGAGKGRTSPERWHNGSLDLAIAPGGDIYATWTEYEGPLRVTRSTDGGESFEDPIHVAGDEADPARAPTLAVAPDGSIYLAWTFGERPDADIYITRSDDGGQSFATPQKAIDTDGHSDSPSLAIDAEDTLHLAIADSRRGLFERYAVYYARSTDEGQTFEELREISNVDRSTDEGASFPSLELDGKGNPFVMWEHFPDYQQRPMGLKFTSSFDGGDSFEAPTLVPNSAVAAHGISGGLQGLLMDKLAITDDGGLAIVHSHFQEGQASHIQLFRAQIE